MVLAYIRQGRRGRHSSKTAPVHIIARGVFRTSDLYSSGWPGTHGNSPVSDFQVLEFLQKLLCPARVSHFPFHSSGGPTRVSAEPIPHALDHSVPWISLGLASISDVLCQKKWGTRYVETSLMPEKICVEDKGRLASPRAWSVPRSAPPSKGHGQEAGSDRNQSQRDGQCKLCPLSCPVPHPGAPGIGSRVLKVNMALHGFCCTVHTHASGYILSVLAGSCHL